MSAIGIQGAGRMVELETPEQVPLAFEVASPGGRLLAFGLDVLVIAAVLLLIAVVGRALVVDGVADEISSLELLVDAVNTVVSFLFINFYFVALELRWQGRTIGKRVAGLRVIARDGGPLSSGLVISRNFMRNLEIVIPYQVLVFPEVLGVEGALWTVVSSLWIVVMLVIPLVNRVHARAGDLVAGTLVVNAPDPKLLDDLVAERASSEAGGGDFFFSQAQLDLYGIHELQILEDVLRRYPQQIDLDLLVTIARKIRTKTGWEAPDASEPEPYLFLSAFYAAQRERLEHKMLFGRRQERKVR